MHIMTTPLETAEFLFFIVVPCILILSESFLFSPMDAIYICLEVY